MRISGFSFIRNGLKLHYPFVESIRSILPVCDEFVLVVGNSEDGTRRTVENLNNSKIKIIDTVWDESLRSGGKILAQQTNLALDAITGDWGFYLQGDEVVHENDLNKIYDAAIKYLAERKVEGLLFKWIHFYGNYDFIGLPQSRGIYPYEVRIIRNDPKIRSFRDAQGFRKFSSSRSYERGDAGEKLWVRKIDATIFHYGKVRGPKIEMERWKDFNRHYHSDEQIGEMFGSKEEFEYHPKFKLIPFTGSHPQVMHERIDRLNWNFQYDSSYRKTPVHYHFLNVVEKFTGKRLFDFRNYRLLKER